ncbi:extracellular matrix protein [Diaporthe helianthi]|uniref:Extracellular matrix protein n=1 Tax=Diaporthe helianthi TaxID=158607 RepID=A0A2P5IE46_DIAHE|nr:extracellular matrix protein [Diaporthe helianthi]
MKFTAGFIAVVTAAAPAWAIQLTNSAYAVQAGQPFTLTWSDSVGPVTITLKNGASTDLKDVEVIASGITTNSFTWTPPSSLPSDLYAFEVDDDSDNSPNYSPQFTFQGNGAATSDASVSATPSASVSTTLSSAPTTTPTANTSTPITSSASGNGTSTTASSTSSTRTTRTSASSTSESTSESTPINTNDSQKLGSPLALVLGTIVSLLIFN